MSPQQFVDECNLHVKGGDGGAGSVSFRREAHVPKGGPDGGDGGKGGDVWLVADRNVASLLSFKDTPFRRAGDGTHGMGKHRHGRAGTDLIVAVPEGTTVLDRDGTLLADLVAAGDRWVAGEGGRGGRGNARFLSNRRRVPAFAEQGEEGEERWLRLELKLLADVALVGLPNVGKSTLISRISAAKPKIADYPFTTLEPHLGVVRLDRGFEYVVADVPGLIEGASEGKGLGHRFLRHVERARVLCVLLDLSPTAEMPPAQQLDVLLQELGAYQPDLLDRPRILIGSRADLAPPPTPGAADADRVAGTGADRVVAADADRVAGTGADRVVATDADRAAGTGADPAVAADADPAVGASADADAARAGGGTESGAGAVAGRTPGAAVGGSGASRRAGGEHRPSWAPSGHWTDDAELVELAALGVDVEAELAAAAAAEVAARTVDGVELDLRVSAVTGAGIAELTGLLGDAVRQAREELPEPIQFVVHRPVRQGYEVHREGGGWVVEGRDAIRAVALSDLTRHDALAEAHRRLQALGVDKALAKAGARPGDPVRIGGLVFDYADEE